MIPIVNQLKNKIMNSEHKKLIYIVTIILVITLIFLSSLIIYKNSKYKNIVTVKNTSKSCSNSGIIHIRNNSNFYTGMIVNKLGLVITTVSFNEKEEIMAFIDPYNKNSVEQSNLITIPGASKEGLSFLKISKTNSYETAQLSNSTLKKGDNLKALNCINEKNYTTTPNSIIDLINKDNYLFYKLTNPLNIGSIIINNDNEIVGIAVKESEENRTTTLVLSSISINQLLADLLKNNNNLFS